MTAGIMALAAFLGAGYRGRILAGLLFLGAPMAVTFNMVYTEAPFLALCVWALIFMIQERWWQTTVLIYLLGFVRLTAIDLVATFAIIVLLYARTNWRAWLGVAVSGLSLITCIHPGHWRLFRHAVERLELHIRLGGRYRRLGV